MILAQKNSARFSEKEEQYERRFDKFNTGSAVVSPTQPHVMELLHR
eukprot:CAMPEP_0202117086 /NCGR_PEP_ID=MMETSP0965-20130614/42049_1 /ASSEMBLY_ACC=CAM_ASM_000507 /TAXON_ID=4773 /ORGANISM="Schizochytrium aggregatum, Strain ATCC28209" /LENGTH=45 /DNA_ID= /DNA_START= /DNA_END= /DNA_ORIENTATION=